MRRIHTSAKRAVTAGGLGSGAPGQPSPSASWGDYNSHVTRKFRTRIAGVWAIAASVLFPMSQSASANSAEYEHLEPCRVLFPDYESRVESISRAAMPGEVALWVTVIPSFRPEWSVGISTDKGRYLVTHVVFKRSLWSRSSVATGPNTFSYDFSIPRVQTTATTASISAVLYEALRSEWSRSIDGVQPVGGIPEEMVIKKFVWTE